MSKDFYYWNKERTEEYDVTDAIIDQMMSLSIILQKQNEEIHLIIQVMSNLQKQISFIMDYLGKVKK